MIERIVRAIGQSIDHISRQCLRRAYGLRMPAARMRIRDRIKDREYVEARVQDEQSDLAYWQGQLPASENAIEEARADFVEIAIRATRRGLVPTSTPGYSPWRGLPK